MKKEGNIYKMRATHALFVSLLLAACTSQTVKQSGLPDQKHQFTVVASMSRHLNLEPCGCTFHPQGGLEWEWHQWDAWKKEGLKNSLFISGGSTFDYTDPYAPKLTEGERFIKAQTLVDGLNLLELQALGFTSNDFQFPLKKLAELKERSKFPWISTNLKMPSAPFVPVHAFERGGVPIAVFSLTRKAKGKLPKGVEWVKPENAIKTAVESLPKEKKYFTVVLSDLSMDERDAVLEAFPGVNAWIGQAAENDFSLSYEMLKRDSIFVHPEYFGRDYARIDVATEGDWESFRIPAYEPAAKENYERFSKLLFETERELAAFSGPESRTDLEQKRAFYKSQVNRYAFVGESRNPKAATLLLTLSDIDSKLNHGKNPTTELIEKYRQRIQEKD